MRASVRGRRLARLVGAVVLVLGAAHQAAAARWYEDYQKALGLLDKGGCSQDAISLLQSALEDRGKPDANARTLAVRPIRYIPYYQLARAYLACGDSATAKVYLERAKSYGVASAQELGVIERGLAAMTKEQEGGGLSDAELDKLLGQARDSVGLAERAAQRLADERARPQAGQLMAQSPPLGQRAQAAESDLARARKTLAEGREAKPFEIVEAATLAARAMQELEAVRSELVVRRNRLAQAATPTPVRVVRVEPTATPSPRPTATPAPPPTRAPLPPTATPTSRPAATPRQVVPTPAAVVPEPLRTAAAAYLEADYRGVLTPLAKGDLVGRQAQLAGHLLAAAARFALWVGDGAHDDGLRTAAADDVAAVRRLDPTYEPDPKLFSPRFIAFFNGRG